VVVVLAEKKFDKPNQEERPWQRKTTNLSVVKPQTEVQRKSYEDLEKEAEAWRITRQEVRARVHALRTELEEYKSQIEGVPFDILADAIPRCLDNTRREDLNDLVTGLNPLIGGLFKRCDDVARRHGVDAEMDYNAQLFELEMQLSDTGYYIGILAGVIFAGCSKETIDRFEHGLGFALESKHGVVKDD